MTSSIENVVEVEANTQADGGQSMVTPYMNHSDEDLLRAIAEGDKDALGALYHRFAPRLLGVARRTLAHQADAEDLVHDVFLEVWRRAGDYDAARGTVAAWLLVRTRSRALDRLKSNNRIRGKSLDDVSSSEDDNASVVESVAAETRDPALDLDSAEVWYAMGDLPADQRAVVELAYFEGLTLMEVGVSLGIPAGTAKSRLARAVAALRNLFVYLLLTG